VSPRIGLRRVGGSYLSIHWDAAQAGAAQGDAKRSVAAAYPHSKRPVFCRDNRWIGATGNSASLHISERLDREELAHFIGIIEFEQNKN
jgi:hypothetical protein